MNQVRSEHSFPAGQRLQLVEGDLTEERVDAIVNAANEHLQHGGGVAAAISRKGGPAIQAESTAWVKEHGIVTPDRPALTSAGSLPARYVIHAVGPVWSKQDEQAAREADAKLRAAVTGALRLAGEQGISSIALPAISTGIFGFPKDRAARVILSAVQDYFTDNPGSSLRLVRLALFDRPTLEAFQEAWQEMKW